MNAFRVVSVVSLGLLAGSLLLEGLVLVPHWRSLGSSAFAELHAGFAPRLYRYFAPLTAGAVLISVSAALAVAWTTEPNATDWFTVAAGAFAASLLAFYRLYFHSANARLPLLARSGDALGLSSELHRWQRTHQVRTAVSLVAFVLAELGVAG